MTKKLEILKESLTKKEAGLEQRFNNHFETVRQANGQPLNDKRNGRVTLNKWERQSNSIRNQQAEVEKTRAAIEREGEKISDVSSWYQKMPKALTDLIDSGTLIQWRRHPRMMFVKDVEKARIIFNDGSGLISHKYVKLIPTKEQYAIFRDIYNGARAACSTVP